MPKTLYPPKRWLVWGLLGAGLLLGSCSKPDADWSSVLFVNFGPGEGFSYRTANNIPVGSQDPTDWTLDRNWNARERNLFQSLSLNFDDASPLLTSGVGMGGYPNPAVSQLSFFYFAPTTVTCKYVVVDASYRPIAENSFLTPASQMTFSLNLTKYATLQSGRLYRLYYVLYNGSTVYYKGHGDFKIAD